MGKISAAILIHNNEETITATIKSIDDIVDEIIIIDDYSSDNTIEIIKNLTCKAKIYTRALNNDFAAQRNFSLEKCSNEWVLVIDSDEEIDDILKQSILKEVKSPRSVAYNCIRLNENIAGATEVKLDRPILMKKNLFFKDAIHEIISEPMTFIKDGKLLHHCWFGMNDFMDDLNKYSTWKAKKWILEGRKYTPLFLCVRQPLVSAYFFIRRYVFERRFKHGSIGFLYALAWSTEELFVGLKYYEMLKMENKS